MKSAFFQNILKKSIIGWINLQTANRLGGVSRHMTLISLFIAGIVLSEPSWAFQKECRISGAKGQTKNILSQNYPKTVVGKIPSKEVVYIGWDYGDESQLYKLEGTKFVQLGMLKNTDIDCTSIGPSDGYPIIFDNTKQLFDATGLVFDDLDEARSAGGSLYKCLYIGDGNPGIWLSKEFMSRYEAKNLPLDKICTVLESGQVRFDPETGARLPTYVVKGSGRGEEYSLIAPDCFSKGKLDLSGSNSGILKPIGCKVRYHPYSGRKLTSKESDALTDLTRLAIDGSAGEVKEDSANLLSTSARKGSSVNIDSLKQMLK